ncbi:hypothetical protein PF005_g6996 [Phytophthora fragariae]|uniref:Uncharacterized protein n=1 Tax=Phytophthora fragariae TaxID=53985 RepID=A0A6A3YMG0_9STRA|nr:hypothetical protein PF009_g14216 [Phytophthora fragariae]KAE8994368.1 hypothetical protein PF011_g16756 [Phytophthora fragariae]KAE9088427.1 hypothetical protein PF010_g19384 [Phytophthora fragariae]KAE9148101.1 hypothetical protein PF006_g7274 [Phytophthora fragariae]KAE9200787.1 hypothetical protein PF004_g18901 [Phytophthora fragariae]
MEEALLTLVEAKESRSTRTKRDPVCCRSNGRVELIQRIAVYTLLETFVKLHGSPQQDRRRHHESVDSENVATSSMRFAKASFGRQGQCWLNCAYTAGAV